MLRYRRRAADADVRHFQWLPLEPLDLRLLPRPAAGADDAQRDPRDPTSTAGSWTRMDAVIVHTRRAPSCSAAPERVT